jgi:hypothetical protein
VGAGAFFALASAKPKKERESTKKKKPEKKRKRQVRKKKARILALSSPHNGNPVSEPKANRQGENNGLEHDRQKRTGKVG